MIVATAALAAVPKGLREPLIAEYKSIVQNFMEHRWLPSELGGGRFSEIVYTILDGQAKKAYASGPKKPANFQQACQKLESNALPHVPRSFQILIPRILPALYEVRNNRSVGHVGGDVNPNHMDSVAVLSICNWVMGELVRVYHGLTITEAQQVVDALAEVRVSAVWSDGSIKRVLLPTLSLPDQILLLIATSLPNVTPGQLILWTEAPNKTYFMKVLRGFHKKRLVEFDESSGKVQILPPGAQYVQELVRRKQLSKVI
ncbi:MAG: hypothetical protein ABSD43_02630 [Terracidiphilus sp.]|jgi:hypothetical protein